MASSSSPPMSPSAAASDDFGKLPTPSPTSSTTLNQVYTQVPSAPKGASHPAPFEIPSSQARSVLDSISDPFPPFDVQSAIVHPFQTETERDAQFERELTSMLLEVMLEFYAWSAARPRGESDSSGSAIEDRIGNVMKAQMEQEETRRRLSDFIKQVKTALDALTGIGF